MFIKYQHIERLGKPKTEGILNGTVYIQPKLDGANGSFWFSDVLEEKVSCGSRNQRLTVSNTNKGFWNYCQETEWIYTLARENKNLRFYGEWLVPHTIKHYDKSAYRQFYIFDVSYIDKEKEFINIEEWIPIVLKYASVENIVPFMKFENPTEQQIQEFANNDKFLISGEGFGEGVVVKNFEYRDYQGEQTFAKYLRSTFKEEFYDNAGKPQEVEALIVNKYCTKEFVDKEYAKILNNEVLWKNGDVEQKRLIPILLNFTWETFLEEEITDIVKKHKYPTIDFRRLNKLWVSKVKEWKWELF